MQIISVSAGTGSEECGLVRQYQRLRARVFGSRLGWEVHVDDGREHDQYDLLNPTYLLVVYNSGEVIGGARLLPTTGPTMLADTFPCLLDGAKAPQSPTIVESSRFCVDTASSGAVSATGLRGATHTLFAGIIEWSMANGFEQIVTVTDIRFQRILNRAKWPLTRLGSPHPIGNTVAVAGLLAADRESFETVRLVDYSAVTPAHTNVAA